VAPQRILVVDDEESIRSLLSEALATAGYEVLTAGSGEEALELLGSENLQVMLLDLKLPGMDGLELCRRIRQERPGAVIYAMTGYASRFSQAQCREVGFDDFFLKPLRLKTLFKAADQAFDKLLRSDPGRAEPLAN